MADFLRYLDDLYGAQKPQTAQPTSAPTPIGAPPAVSTSFSSGNPTQGAGSGRFVNFDRYIAANQDTAGKTAGNLADNTESLGNSATKGVNDYSQKFQNDVGSGINYYDGQQVAIPGDDSTSGGTSYDDALARSTRGYTGPMDFTGGEGYQAVQDSVNKAQSAADNIGSYAGRSEMLKDYVKGKGANHYSEGMSDFDSALTGAMGNSRFGALQKRFSGLSKLLEDRGAQAGQTIEGAEKLSDIGNTGWQGALDNYARIMDELAKPKQPKQADLSSLNGPYAGPTDPDGGYTLEDYLNYWR